MILSRILSGLTAVLILFAGASRAALAPQDLAPVGFDQRLGERLPAALELVDADGRLVRLGTLWAGRPLILLLGYYECPNLCGIAFGSLLRGLAELPFAPDTDYAVALMSIDPMEGPAEAARMRQRLRARGEAAARWHLLTGSPQAIEQLTAAAGFRYRLDPQARQFAHASGLVFVSPAGQIVSYLPGLDYRPMDLRLGLVDAAEGRIGTVADTIRMLCYGFDPARGEYSLLIWNVVRAAAAATALGLAVGIVVLRRRTERS